MNARHDARRCQIVSAPRHCAIARTTSVRAALLWSPTDAFDLTLAYNYAYSKGVGGNIDNNSFKGGPSPLDPRRLLRATGDYERSLPTLEPWNRRPQAA